ncbi:MAG: c-type cytochrome [Candidatus Nanopelagicales bacterium]
MTGSVPWRRRPIASFFLLSAALAVVGTIYALITDAPWARAAGVAHSATAVETGKALFLEGCASCHGLNGEGSSTAPSLIGAGSAAVDFQLATGRMPLAQPQPQAPRKDPTYDQAQIDAIAAFVDSLGPGPQSPTAEDLDLTGADLARGGELFSTNCAQCHNFAGKGAALTEGKYAPSLMAATPNQIYEAMLTGPANMPKFGDGTLTPTDKKDVIAYVEHLQTQPSEGGLPLGSFGPVTEGLLVFIAVAAVLGAATVWIGARAR